MSISIGLYPKLDLWTVNKLHYIKLQHLNAFITRQFKEIDSMWGIKGLYSAPRVAACEKLTAHTVHQNLQCVKS
jgi:hypothetical protein